MNIIVAASKNMGIGLKNKLPWALKNELKYFKKKTIGGGNNIVLMGKNTWLGLPKKPLPYRYNCVLSSTLETDCKNTKIVRSKKEFERVAMEHFYSNIWIIGGESIYKQFINEPYIENIYLTHILEDFECDTFFPDIPNSFYLNKISDCKSENNVIYRYKVFSKMGRQNEYVNIPKQELIRTKINDDFYTDNKCQDLIDYQEKTEVV